MKRSVSVPMFDCEFKCSCGSVIGWKGPEAIVKSQTGAHVHCRHCLAIWSVTPYGATMIREGRNVQSASREQTPDSDSALAVPNGELD